MNISRKSILVCIALTAMVNGTPSFAANDNKKETTKLFREGLYQREQGDLTKAIETFQTVLNLSPELDRVRLELAVAYYRAMDYEKAKSHAEAVLAKPDIPDNVRISVLAFLAQLKNDQDASAKKKSWAGNISIGFMHDTNVNAGPSGSTFQGGLITLLPSDVARADNATTLSAGISHKYQSPTPVKIGDSFAHQFWQSRANFYAKENFNQHSSDLEVLSLSTGPAWFALNKWRANINASVDHYQYGGIRLAVYSSLLPSITWQMGNSELTWDILAQKRDFARPGDTGKDSHYSATGAYFGHVYDKGNLTAQAGIRYFREAAEENFYSNDGHEFFIGASVVTWKQGSAYGRIIQRDTEWDANEPTLTSIRGETLRTYEIGFNHDFKEDMLKDWRLTGSITAYHNNSNIDYSNYTRTMTGLSLNRAFD